MRWITNVMPAAVMLMGAWAALCPGAARAENEGTEIDCGDTDLKLNAPDFKVTCKDYSDPTALSSAGRIQAEVMTAISEKQEQVLQILDIRALGSIYLRRQGFQEDVHGFFPDEMLDEWKTTEEVAGFEFAQYVNQRSGASEEECIAFRRQMTRRNGGVGDSGFARIVLGFGCTAGDRAALVESLKQLDAPGS